MQELLFGFVNRRRVASSFAAASSSILMIRGGRCLATSAMDMSLFSNLHGKNGNDSKTSHPTSSSTGGELLNHWRFFWRWRASFFCHHLQRTFDLGTALSSTSSGHISSADDQLISYSDESAKTNRLIETCYGKVRTSSPPTRGYSSVLLLWTVTCIDCSTARAISTARDNRTLKQK